MTECLTVLEVRKKSKNFFDRSVYKILWKNHDSPSRKLIADVFLFFFQNPIPTNKPGVEPKRPPRPVNISPLVKLSPTVGNQIYVTWSADYSRRYAIAIYLVKKLSSSELLTRLKSRGVRHSDYTRGLSKSSVMRKGTTIPCLAY